MCFSDDISKSIVDEFGKTIWSKFRKGVKDYQLVQHGDRIAVCISGGKDSMLMGQCMKRLQKYGGINFDLLYIVMNPGYNSQNLCKITENANILQLPIQVYQTKIFESVQNTPQNPCFLCARLRRGWLYKKAQELGCNKIALGHHFDDVVETILMGMLYGSQVQTMMPKLHSENYHGMELIRPLYLVREESILNWADYNNLDFIQCGCSVSEKNTDKNAGSKRHEVKLLLRQLREVNPNVDKNIFRSVQNVNLQTLISYHIGQDYHHFLDDYEEGRNIRGTIN